MVFDLKQSVLILNKTSGIPFKDFTEFNFTHLHGIKGSSSYHLNLIIGHQEMTIFQSEYIDPMIDSGHYLAKMTEIPLNEKFKPA